MVEYNQDYCIENGKDSEFEKNIQIISNDFNKDNKIIVEGFKWNNSYFVSGYYSFTIKIIGEKTSNIIDRRFSEIEWLHEKLLKYCAGCIIPTQLRKKVYANLPYGYSNELINQRKKEIEDYLNSINNHKLLKANEYFQIFLDDNKFNIEKELIQTNRSYFSNLTGMLSNSVTNIKDNILGPNINSSNSIMLKDNVKVYNIQDKQDMEKLRDGVKSIIGNIEKLKVIYEKKQNYFKNFQDSCNNIFEKEKKGNVDNKEKIEEKKVNQSDYLKHLDKGLLILDAIKKGHQKYRDSFDVKIKNLKVRI